MTMLRITSVDRSLDSPGLRSAAANLVRRALGLGMLSDRAQVARLDLALLESIAREASEAGVGREAAVSLLGTSQRGRDLEALLVKLDAAIAASPVPDRELRELMRVYEQDVLASMLGVSAASLRRYASAARPVPDPVAQRIHFLALVTSDLAGSYNEYGLRRWWERPRVALDGRSPRAVLGSAWSPDDPAAVQVGELAAALTGSASAVEQGFSPIGSSA